MSYRGTFLKIHQLYGAWNERRWPDYAELFAPDLAAYPARGGAPMDKDAYIAREQRFCAAYPDSRVHADPHLILFGDPHGARICAVSRLTGTRRRAGRPPAAFDVVLAVVYLWRESRIVEHRRYLNWKDGPMLMHGIDP